MAARTIAAAAAVTLAHADYPQCLDSYQCTYRAMVPQKGQEYSWDLSQLCRQQSEYVARLGHSDQYIAFNICGNTTSMCSFDPDMPTYASRGSAIQYLQGWSSDSSQLQPPTLGVNGECPAGRGLNCTNWDLQPPGPTDGAAGCCTDPCELIASGYSRFSLLDVTDAQAGVQFDFAPLGTLLDDQFACGIDRTGKLAIQRRTTIKLYCSAEAGAGLSSIKATETSICHYLIEATTPAACGVVGK